MYFTSMYQKVCSAKNWQGIIAGWHGEDANKGNLIKTTSGPVNHALWA
jgi:hypothetical protein